MPEPATDPEPDRMPNPKADDAKPRGRDGPMHVLAVGAHPDDVEILCSGTLARFVQEGHRVTIAHASLGDKGHAEIPHDRVATVRREEARAAAATIGADSVTLGFLDGQIDGGADAQRRTVDLIRAVRPDLILTHHPNDYHGDHRAVTTLVLDASFMATIPYYPSTHPAHDVTCPVYFMDTVTGLGFEPSDYVDVTATMDLKQRAMACHRSQVDWLDDHHATGVADLIDATARFRGLQCGVRYAEAFARMEAWGRVHPTRHLP